MVARSGDGRQRSGRADTQDDSRSSTPLVELGQSFARLRRRCARQGRHVRQLAAEADRIATLATKPTTGSGRRHRAALDAIREKVGYHAAWAQWSASADEIAALIDRIARHPARGIDDLIIKYDALQWSLLDDGAAFDTAVRRQVVAFRRDLVALAGSR
ncbi:MAG: hypothetical protein HY834_20445 [Devosia nanyangense]|uniref:Uncharacterized protein n=1 Tax=Devosia nanyangense TaxID=1228055 RepID=A0A933P0Y2_9HYPH|nr:hypothetical protein [Devosia nanyangense]